MKQCGVSGSEVCPVFPWFDVDAHLGQLVVTTALGEGKTSWRLANSGSTSGVRPLARVTIGRRF